MTARRADGQHNNGYEWLSKITYKPNWKFELEEDRNTPTRFMQNFLYLRITTHQPNADRSLQSVLLTSSHALSPEAFMDKSHFLMIVEHAIRDAEMHEVDEWLKFDGKHIRHPHPIDIKNA